VGTLTLLAEWIQYETKKRRMLARLRLSGARAPKFDITKSRSNAMANFCAAVECLGTFRPWC